MASRVCLSGGNSSIITLFQHIIKSWYFSGVSVLNHHLMTWPSHLEVQWNPVKNPEMDSMSYNDTNLDESLLATNSLLSSKALPLSHFFNLKLTWFLILIPFAHPTSSLKASVYCWIWDNIPSNRCILSLLTDWFLLPLLSLSHTVCPYPCVWKIPFLYNQSINPVVLPSKYPISSAIAIPLLYL